MTSPLIEIKGLEELRARMAQFPRELEQFEKVTMDASLTTLWENVPPYPAPPAPIQGPQMQPVNFSTKAGKSVSFWASVRKPYTRTGTHGRMLGSGYGGGKSGGGPSIYNTKKLGNGYEGQFGTNLEYSKWVIGDTTQADVHKGRWYTMGDIKKKSEAKIIKLWEIMADKLAKFLDGKGL